MEAMNVKTQRRVVLAVYGIGGLGVGHAGAVAWTETGYVFVGIAVWLVSAACLGALAEWVERRLNDLRKEATSTS